MQSINASPGHACGSAFRRCYAPGPGGFGGTWLGNQWLNFGIWHAERLGSPISWCAGARKPTIRKCIRKRWWWQVAVGSLHDKTRLGRATIAGSAPGGTLEVAATRSDALLVAARPHHSHHSPTRTPETPAHPPSAISDDRRGQTVRERERSTGGLCVHQVGPAP